MECEPALVSSISRLRMSTRGGARRKRRKWNMRLASKLALALLAGSMASWGAPALAASHREAPLIAMDPAADNTDVYAFVSYDAANLARASTDRRVTFI